MLDRRMLVLLLLLIVHQFYLQPQADRTESLRNQAAILQQKIFREQNISRIRPDLARRLEEFAGIAAANRPLLFPAEQNNSSALGELQKQTRAVAEQAGLEFVRANWGEPWSEEGAGYLQLPLTIVVQGSPRRIDSFLRNLYASGRYLTSDSVRLMPRKKELLMLTMNLVGYKFLPSAAVGSAPLAVFKSGA